MTTGRQCCDYLEPTLFVANCAVVAPLSGQLVCVQARELEVDGGSYIIPMSVFSQWVFAS